MKPSSELVSYHVVSETSVSITFCVYTSHHKTITCIHRTVGAPLSGRISDRTVVKWRKWRGGKWVPEDRLRATLWGATALVPLSILGSGLLTQFVEGRIGLVLNLVCLFVNGLGVRTFML
jgi:hypothetical protein